VVRFAITKPASPQPAPASAFVARQGPDLYLNGRVFRFAGPNMGWLGLSEDGGVHYPSHAEIDDAMNDAQEMGANVVRTHGAVGVGCSLCIQPTLGDFRDGLEGRPTAFDSLDYAVAAAKRRGIRLIMELVDNWEGYDGGKVTYLRWRGLSTANGGRLFFTDPTVRNDFKRHISTVLNHVNPYTGKAYREDPTIMAWETGNELSVEPDPWTHSGWTRDIAAHIKSLAPNQLVADGHYGIHTRTWGTELDTASLQLPNVDIYTWHEYGGAADRPTQIIDQSNTVRNTFNKVYFLGEYSWTDRQGSGPCNPCAPREWPLYDLLPAIENSNMTGDLYWQLMPTGVVHDDGFMLHWPGDNPDMQARAQRLKDHAFRMCPAGGACRAP
jgi:mannan endo-1,4-beta-mannosidase